MSPLEIVPPPHSEHVDDVPDTYASGPGLGAKPIPPDGAENPISIGIEFGQRALENAEYLLNHALESGIEVDPEVAQKI